MWVRGYCGRDLGIAVVEPPRGSTWRRVSCTCVEIWYHRARTESIRTVRPWRRDRVWWACGTKAGDRWGLPKGPGRAVAPAPPDASRAGEADASVIPHEHVTTAAAAERRRASRGRRLPEACSTMARLLLGCVCFGPCGSMVSRESVGGTNVSKKQNTSETESDEDVEVRGETELASSTTFFVGPFFCGPSPYWVSRRP